MSILQSAISTDIAGKRWLGLILICFHQFEIRPDGGQKEFLQLRTVEQFPGRAVQAAQLGNEFRFRKIERRRIGIGNLWRATSGNEQCKRSRLASTPKFTCKFKADDRAHAVSPERECRRDFRHNGVSQSGYQRFILLERRLPDARPPAWQTCQRERCLWRKMPLPAAEYLRASPSIGKAVQPECSDSSSRKIFKPHQL